MAAKLNTPFENCAAAPGSGDNGNLDSPISGHAGVQPESLKVKFMEKLPVSDAALVTPFKDGLSIPNTKK